MAKVKFDVSGSDAEEATKVKSFDSPLPGQYVATIKEVNAKGSGGDPDKPMLEVVYEITAAEKKSNEKFVGSQMWYYVLLPGHPSYEKGSFPEQKTDQFLQANGLANKKKRKGSFDTDDLEGNENVLVVRAGKDRNDPDAYRGEVGNVLPYDEDTFGSSEDEDDEDEPISEDDEIDEDDEDEDEDETEEEDEEEEDDEEDDEEDEEEEDEEEDEEEEEDEGDDEEEDEEEEEPAPKRRRSRKSTAKKSTAKRGGSGRGSRSKSTAKRGAKSTAKRGTAKRGGRGKGSRGGRSGFPFDE